MADHFHTLDGVAAGSVAAGGADSGNPVKVGGRYSATAPTLDDGDRGDLQLDGNSNLRVTQATALAGEHLALDTLGVTPKPVISSTYSGTVFADFGSNKSASVTVVPSMLKSIRATNVNAAVRYLQVFNLAAAPTEDSSAPVLSIPIPAGSATAPAAVAVGANELGEAGLYLSAGLAWGISASVGVFNADAVTASEHTVNGIRV